MTSFYQNTLLLIVLTFWMHNCMGQPTYSVPKIENQRIYNDLNLTLKAVQPIGKDGSCWLLGENEKQQLQLIQLNAQGDITKKETIHRPMSSQPTAYYFQNDKTVYWVHTNTRQQLTIEAFEIKTGKITAVATLPDSIKGTIYSLTMTDEGTFALAGQTAGQPGTRDMLVVSLDRKGKVKWCNRFGARVGDDGLYYITPDKKDGFLVAGYVDDFDAKENYAFVMRLLHNGKNDWERKFGTSESNTMAYSITRGTDDYPIFAGTIEDTIRVTQLDKNEDVIWSRHISGKEGQYTAKGILYTPNKRCIVVGNIIHNQTVRVFIARLNTTDFEKTKKKEIPSNKKSKLMPTVRLEVIHNGQPHPIQYINKHYITSAQPDQQFQLYADYPKTGHFYLFSINAKQKVTHHFPRKNGRLDYTTKGKVYIPNRDSTLWVRDQGQEYWIGLYSSQPIKNIKTIANRLAKKEGTPIQHLPSALGKQLPTKLQYDTKNLAVQTTAEGKIYPLVLQLNIKDTLPTPTTKPNLYVLTIGNNESGFSTAPADYAEQDATDVANFFKVFSHSDFYHTIEVEQLTGPKATTMNIKKAIEYFTIKEFQPHDRVILFLSGVSRIHNGQSILLPADFDAKAPISTSLSYDFIFNTFGKLPCHKLLLSDACYAKASPPKLEHFTAIFGASPTQEAYEAKAWKNGAFTEALLQVLQTNTTTLTTKVLYEHIHSTVPKLVKQKYRQVQEPVLYPKKVKTIKLW